MVAVLLIYLIYDHKIKLKLVKQSKFGFNYIFLKKKL